jgi:DNA polymerase III epsilon subunit family exonuclease
MKDVGFAVIDLETTGLDKNGTDEIVEIAVVLLDSRLSVVGYYETLVKPVGKMGAQHIHKINDALVKDAPLFSDIVETVLTLLKGRKLVAHNAEFESHFLRKEFSKVGVGIGEEHFIDTLKLARELNQQQNMKLKSYKLAAVAEYFKVPFFNHHMALSDSLATASVLYELKRFNKYTMRRAFRKVKPFKYTGSIEVDTQNWLPRNPDAVVTLYAPYEKWSLGKWFKGWKSKLSSLIRVFGGILFSAVFWFLLRDTNFGALIGFLIGVILASWAEHRFIQSKYRRRVKTAKHQLGLSSVETEGGSANWTPPVDEPLGGVSEVDSADDLVSDEFEEFLGEIIPSAPFVESAKVPMYAESQVWDKVDEDNKQVPIPVHVPLVKVEDSPSGVDANMGNVESPSLQELLKPRRLSDVEFVLKPKVLPNGDAWIYSIDKAAYEAPQFEIDYIFRIVEYYVENANLSTGSLFQVARVNNGNVLQLEKNDIRGTFNVKDSFTFEDNSSYVLLYDEGIMFVLRSANVVWMPFGSIEFALYNKQENSDMLNIAVGKDGVAIDGDVADAVAKLLRKLKITVKSRSV